MSSQRKYDILKAKRKLAENLQQRMKGEVRASIERETNSSKHRRSETYAHIPCLEVMCLTVNKEQLTIYLPPSLPHEKAVMTVEDILEVNESV